MVKVKEHVREINQAQRNKVRATLDNAVWSIRRTMIAAKDVIDQEADEFIAPGLRVKFKEDVKQLLRQTGFDD